MYYMYTLYRSVHTIHRHTFYLQMSGDPGISAFPDGDNLFKWIATLHGPKDTVSTVTVKNMYQNFQMSENLAVINLKKPKS